MHLPSHPLWFWVVLASWLVVWPILWFVARSDKVSVKPLRPWFLAGWCLSAPVYFLFDPYLAIGDHKVLHLLSGEIYWTCWLMWISTARRENFAVLRAPGNKWYLPWTAARFSVPAGMRIHVRNMDSVAPWYVEKLGLRKSSENPLGETGITAFKFNEDGNSVVLTTGAGYGSDRPHIFFTKKIGKIKNVLAERGVTVGEIEKDRQGIRYFQIHDPEGNAIEIVEDR